MGRRPAYCYTRVDRPANTRKKFIKGGPDSKIRIFELGSPSKDFPVTVSLFSQRKCQISHNALEAARIQVNRYLVKKVTRENFHYRICVYPHHIMRENKMMTGAGADRVQEGMRRAFGKPIGRAARVKDGQRLLMVRINPEHIREAKEALRRGKYKFPCPTRIAIEKGQELVK